MAARTGREMPPVPGSVAIGLAEALADGLIEALAEDVASPPPDTLTLAVISGCIEQWYV